MRRRRTEARRRNTRNACPQARLKLTLRHATAIPAVQFNAVYQTPCSAFGSAPDKRYSVRPHVRDATLLEESLLRHFLAGDHPTLESLRVQSEASSVASREFTGVGVYVNFSVPQEPPRVSPPDLIFGDVDLKLENAEPGVCALLYVEHGALSCLELVASPGPWPEEPRVEKMTYLREVPTQNGFSLVPSEKRHAEALSRALLGRKGQGAA